MREGSLKDWLPLKGRWLGYFLAALGWGGRVALVIGVLLLWQSCQPVTLGGTPKGQVATAKAQINAFRVALALYVLDNGQVPTRQQGLDALLTPPTIQPVPRKWTGPYLPDATCVPIDPWCNPYLYKPDVNNPTSYLIISYGKDGKPGGNGYGADLMSDPPRRSN